MTIVLPLTAHRRSLLSICFMFSLESTILAVRLSQSFFPLTSFHTFHIVFFCRFTTLSIHHSFTLSFPAQNSPGLQIFPTTDILRPSELHSRASSRVGSSVLIGFVTARRYASAECATVRYPFVRLSHSHAGIVSKRLNIAYHYATNATQQSVDFSFFVPKILTESLMSRQR